MKIDTLIKKLGNINEEVNVELEYSYCLFLLAKAFAEDIDNSIQEGLIGEGEELVDDIFNNALSSKNYKELHFYVDFVNSDMFNADIEYVLGEEGFNSIQDGLSGDSIFSKKLGSMDLSKIADKFTSILESLMPHDRGQVHLEANKFISYLLGKYENVILEYLADLDDDYNGTD